jgi:hypothetical protein
MSPDLIQHEIELKFRQLASLKMIPLGKTVILYKIT